MKPSNTQDLKKRSPQFLGGFGGERSEVPTSDGASAMSGSRPTSHSPAPATNIRERVERARREEQELLVKWSEFPDPWEEAPAETPPEHQCAGCDRLIPVDFRYCYRCARKSPRRPQYPSWQPTTYPCGCTEQRWKPVGAKDWQQPDPRCVVCGGHKVHYSEKVYASGRMRDRHHYLQVGKEMGHSPDHDPLDPQEFLDAIRAYEESLPAMEGGWLIETAEPPNPKGRTPEEARREAREAKKLAAQQKRDDRAVNDLVVFYLSEGGAPDRKIAAEVGIPAGSVHKAKKRGSALHVQIQDLRAIRATVEEINSRLAGVFPTPAEEAEAYLAQNLIDVAEPKDEDD
jgi:hypothetical protein